MFWIPLNRSWISERAEVATLLTAVDLRGESWSVFSPPMATSLLPSYRLIGPGDSPLRSPLKACLKLLRAGDVEFSLKLKLVSSDSSLPQIKFQTLTLFCFSLIISNFVFALHQVWRLCRQCPLRPPRSVGGFAGKGGHRVRSKSFENLKVWELTDFAVIVAVVVVR